MVTEMPLPAAPMPHFVAIAVARALLPQVRNRNLSYCFFINNSLMKIGLRTSNNQQEP